MPYTVNGIGTFYYGNRNREVRQAACRSCGYYGPLTSYDTRLWFVIVFIPVIPLGRKRIIDECPNCRRHYVAKADEYAMGSQLAVSEAREKYLREPTVQSALEAHGRMLGYHQHEVADALRKEALERFPNDAALRCAFADHLNQMSRYGEAIPLYEEAYKLNEHLPDARLGVAFIRMNEGKLDEARELLDYMEKPGAGQLYALGALETLATLYQKEGRHQEALDLFRHLLNEFPDAAQNHAVRQMIRVSEKKMRAHETILPDRTGSWFGVFNPWSEQYSKGQRTWAFIGLVVALLAIGTLANMAYMGQRRTLHLLSGLDVPVTLQVDDQAPLTVAAHERVVVAEGTHNIAISGPIQAKYTMAVESPFWTRLFKNPVWVVNVGGTAALAQLQVHYSANPLKPTVAVLSGQTTMAFPHIDYPFEEPPKSMKLSNRNDVITKSALVTMQAPPRAVISQIADSQQALGTLEAFLTTRPNDGMLFHVYQEMSQRAKATERAESFLKTGLERRPVEMNWHRTYQNLLEESGRTNESIAIYDAALSKEPANGILIYLRARLEDDPEKADAMYERARTAAPDSSWPWYSIGFRAMSRGDWAKARESFLEAERRGHDPEMVRGGLDVSQLALGDVDAVIAKYRALLQAEPNNAGALAMLLDGLVIKGEIEPAKQELNAWRARMAGNPGPNVVADLLQQLLNYELGDFPAMQGRLDNATEEDLQILRRAMWLVTGRPDRIASEPSLIPQDSTEPWEFLSVSVGFGLIGNEAEAQAWRTKAIERLLKRSGTDRRAAEWLLAETAPDFAQVERTVIDPTYKLMLLCSLAQKFPELREPCTTLAHKLNVSRRPPYHLVQKVFPQ
jgi:tetratricopeptide (TPR) repeat protein